MRNLEKGQHIFIAFQNGKAVLDSQLRPRIYTSLENADKWTPTVNKGKMEYVEYAPTLTPPNEWVSRMREIEELFAKLRAVTGCSLEQIIEMFAAGYTLKKPDYSNETMDRLDETTPPNEPLMCEGCMYAPDLPYEIHCRGCARLYADHYRRPPEGEADGE